MEVRSAYLTNSPIGTGIMVHVDGKLCWWLAVEDGALWAGQPGVGGSDMPAGNGIARVELGLHDRTAPSAINASALAVSAAPNCVVNLRSSGLVTGAG